MPLYNFQCTNEQCNEFSKNQLVKMGTEEISCPKCGEVAKKALSYNFAATGLPNGHITNRGDTRN